MSDDRTPTRKPKPNYPAPGAPDAVEFQADWDKVVVVDFQAGVRAWDSTYGIDAPSVPADIAAQRDARLAAPGGGSNGTTPFDWSRQLNSQPQPITN